jgi:type I restriction enzyme S subunit
VRTNGSIHPEYLAAFLNTRYAKVVLRNMCKSIIGMANINAKELQGICIPQPPWDLQVDFTRRVQALECLKSVHREHLARLDELFASIQHRIFKGEL